jgi:hypothetical protein
MIFLRFLSRDTTSNRKRNKMKQVLALLFTVLTLPSLAQQNYYGIQGSQRKGIQAAIMNPADLNNLYRPVELHFFSSQFALSNNTLSFRDFTNSEDAYFLEGFRNSERPFNGRTVGSILGPSLGLNFGKFALGFSTEFKAAAHFINVDPGLGRYLLENSFESSFSSLSLNSSNNQRVNQVNWMELGLMAAYTLFENERQKLSAGTNIKFLLPGNYTNISIDQFIGSIVQEGSVISLTGARSDIELSYNESILDEGLFNFNLNNSIFSNPVSVGFDLGLSYQIKNQMQRTLFNSGLTVRNLGNLNFGNGQITRTYGMNIPENTSFRLDELPADFQQIETLFIESALFTNTSEKSVNRLSLPTVIAFNADMALIKNLQLSFYGQKAFGNSENNSQVPVQEFYAIIPRLVLGNFEIYSPWTLFDFSGFNGGIGLRYGGFFVGSYSALTSFTLDTKQADFHLGFSWGFGKKERDSN